MSAQAQRNQSTYAALAIDVDHFKQVNDTYGHQIGDDAFEIAEKIRLNVASCILNDIAVRVSIGVGLYQANYSFTDVWKHADIALYQAKNNGRNQTIIAQ